MRTGDRMRTVLTHSLELLAQDDFWPALPILVSTMETSHRRAVNVVQVFRQLQPN